MIHLHETLELPVAGLSGFDAPASEEESAIQASAHRFAKDVLRPIGLTDLVGVRMERLPSVRRYGATEIAQFVTRILPKMGVFFGRNFHPAKHDTRALEREWKEKLFGASGSLTGIVRNRAALAA